MVIFPFVYVFASEAGKKHTQNITISISAKVLSVCACGNIVYFLIVLGLTQLAFCRLRQIC